MSTHYKALWQTAAELFAMSILEICPKVVFHSVRAEALGFVCDFIAPEPLHKDQIALAISRAKEKAKRDIKIEILEMVSTNVIDYMKYLKQPLRARAVDKKNQFTRIVKIDEVYANPLASGVEVELDLSLLEFLEVGETQKVGELSFHKKPAPLYRVSGYAFATTKELKGHKKRLKEGVKVDHRNTPFEGEIVALWRSVYQVVAEALTKEGYIEKWRNTTLSKEEFSECDEPIEDQEKFGLKANGRFRGIKFSLPKEPKNLVKVIKEALPIGSNKDIYDIVWPLIEQDGLGRVWIDRIVALLIEEKNVSKKPFFSTVVTK